MKTILTKVFLVIAALVCMLEGLVLVDVGLGRVPPDRAIDLYVKLFQIPHGLSTVLVLGFLFIILGFILIVLASRAKPVVRIIQVERNGKILNIPYTTIKDFIEQIIAQNPYMHSVSVEFESNGKKAVDINIVSGFRDVPSIHRELNVVEEVLKGEIERVFEWKGFAFHFQLGEVSVNSQKKFFPDSKVPETAEQTAVVDEKLALAIAEAQKIAPPIELDQGEKDDIPAGQADEKSGDPLKPRSMLAGIFRGKR